VSVRWQRLFDDLEAQAEAYASAELEAEVRDQARYEIGRIRLVDRLRAAVGHPIDVGSLGAGRHAGRLERVGADWLLLAAHGGPYSLLPLSAITSVGGLGALSAAPGSEGKVAARLDFRLALRGVVRDRSQTQTLLVDGSIVIGTFDRVGADYVEIAEHPPGEPRRVDVVRGIRTVPTAAVAVVRVW
jgi:hypothetical protein